LELENHGRVRQIGLLRPTRVQFTDPADRLAIEVNTRAAARMHRGMFHRLETQSTGTGAEQRQYIHFDVVKVNLAYRRTPLLFDGGPPGSTGQTQWLADTGDREWAVLLGRIAQEHAAQFEDTNTRLLAVGVVVDVGHQAGDQARTHDRQMARDRVEQAH